MSRHDFQLTYSIPETLDGGSATARDKMRNRPDWDTVDYIETTLTGRLPLQGISVRDKRIQAERDVKQAIKELLKDSRKDDSITLHASLMVCGLGEHIRFEVTA